MPQVTRQHTEHPAGLLKVTGMTWGNLGGLNWHPLDTQSMLSFLVFLPTFVRKASKPDTAQLQEAQPKAD